MIRTILPQFNEPLPLEDLTVQYRQFSRAVLHKAFVDAVKSHEYDDVLDFITNYYGSLFLDMAQIQRREFMEMLRSENWNKNLSYQPL